MLNLVVYPLNNLYYIIRKKHLKLEEIEWQEVPEYGYDNVQVHMHKKAKSFSELIRRG